MKTFIIILGCTAAYLLIGAIFARYIHPRFEKTKREKWEEKNKRCGGFGSKKPASFEMDNFEIITVMLIWPTVPIMIVVTSILKIFLAVARPSKGGRIGRLNVPQESQDSPRVEGKKVRHLWHSDFNPTSNHTGKN